MQVISKIILVVHPGYEHFQTLLKRLDDFRVYSSGMNGKLDDLGEKFIGFSREELSELGARFSEYRSIVQKASGQKDAVVVVDSFMGEIAPL